MIVLPPLIAEMAPGLMAFVVAAAGYGLARYTKYRAQPRD